ncbi:hypothetical protein [Persicobacter psychrovividus]|uniref:Lipocalin-like domain-containing protein n=1 Tax=Persicobacter psychrovividus TaxID=387638 RepID=A0ABN6LFG4_9BACT|nr:hypothetical protein PEPS_24920 [Persicobacter psychrovividus]
MQSLTKLFLFALICSSLFGIGACEPIATEMTPSYGPSMQMNKAYGRWQVVESFYANGTAEELDDQAPIIYEFGEDGHFGYFNNFFSGTHDGGYFFHNIFSVSMKHPHLPSPYLYFELVDTATDSISILQYESNKKLHLTQEEVNAGNSQPTGFPRLTFTRTLKRIEQTPEAD